MNEMIDENMERWGKHIDSLLSSSIPFAKWPDRLDSSASDLISLIVEFQNLEFAVSLRSGISIDQPLPGREALQRHERIARLLAAFCDRKTPIDPSPLLSLIQIRKEFGELKPEPSTGSEIPSVQWERWEVAARHSHVVIERIGLWVESRPTKKGEELSLQDRAMLYWNRNQDQCTGLTVREFAAALGEKHHSKVAKTTAWKLIHGMTKQNKADRDSRYKKHAPKPSGRRSDRIQVDRIRHQNGGD